MPSTRSSAARSRSSSTRRRAGKPIATRSRSVARRSSAACRTSPRSPPPAPRRRASRPCCAGRSRCARSRSITVPRAEPPSAGAGSAEPLADLLQALERPLEYLAGDDFRRAADTKLPLDAIAARIERARATAGPAHEPALAELGEIVAALRHGDDAVA